MTPAFTSIHYHLRPGGVTEVIRQNHRILTGAGIPHRILCGDNPSELPAIVEPSLDYESKDAPDLFLPSGSVLHFHNPCLGKNPALTTWMGSLAEKGHALILQHHDLAEDGRPQNFARLASVANVYPTGPRIAHAFINHRDRRIFIEAGLAETRAILLPNPFDIQPLDPPDQAGPATILHPMRGIPRKNLAELLLLAACAPHGTRFLQGSAPANHAWKSLYEAWHVFARELALPIDFDCFQAAGRDSSYAASTHLLTTSTHEGFGMIHLEGAGRRRVIGRRIPHLHRDLDGFPQDGLYDGIIIDGGKDFPDLDADVQRKVIAHPRNHRLEVVCGDSRISLEKWLKDQLALRDPVDASAGLIRHGDEAHLDRLTRLAMQLLESPPGTIGSLDRDRILSLYERPPSAHPTL